MVIKTLRGPLFRDWSGLVVNVNLSLPEQSERTRKTTKQRMKKVTQHRVTMGTFLKVAKFIGVSLGE